MFLATKERKWILVVDDDPSVCESLRDLIEINFGKDILCVKAKDGMEATCKINYQRFDCIITDLKMPRKVGEAFVHSVRHNSLNETTPIIILSGSPNMKEAAKGMNFVNTVEKPFKLQEMVKLIQTNLNLKSNKNRISADIFNNLVDGVESFVNGLTHKVLQQKGSVCSKAKGTEINHDYASSIQFKIGNVTNTFSLLVHKKDIERLKGDVDFESTQSTEDIMHSMSYVIIRHVMDKSGIGSKEKFNANSIEHNRNLLTGKQGIILQLEHDSFAIDIFATSQ